MSGQMLVMPGLGGATSSKLVISRKDSAIGAFASRTSISMHPSVDAAVGQARNALRGGTRDRLAELREAAAGRARTMPDYEDPIEESVDRAAVIEGLEVLQADTAAWNSED